MSITDDRARRVFVLEVAGLPVRYTSGAFDPTASNFSGAISVVSLMRMWRPLWV